MAEVAKERRRGQGTTGAGLAWKAVVNDPHLRDLPYKIETNEWGQIVMSPPPAFKHGARQSRIARLLEEHLPDGRSVTEAPVRTSGGTKVADVAWLSAERFDEVKDEYDAPVAPEICVEVLSPSNAPGEIEQKRRLYFEAGAEEVWTCSAEGAMRFFGPDGAREASQRAPGFPARVEL